MAQKLLNTTIVSDYSCLVILTQNQEFQHGFKIKWGCSKEIQAHPKMRSDDKSLEKITHHFQLMNNLFLLINEGF